MRLVTGFIMLALLGTTASADVKTNATGKVSVDLPSTWQTKTEKDVLIGEAKDGGVVLMFWVVDKHEAKHALPLLDKALKGKFTKVTWEAPKDVTVDGMKGIRTVGTAVIKGKEAYVMAAIVGPTPTKKGVIVFGAIEKSHLKEHKVEMEYVLDSLKQLHDHKNDQDHKDHNHKEKDGHKH